MFTEVFVYLLYFVNDTNILIFEYFIILSLVPIYEANFKSICSKLAQICVCVWGGGVGGGGIAKFELVCVWGGGGGYTPTTTVGNRD